MPEGASRMIETTLETGCFFPLSTKVVAIHSKQRKASGDYPEAFLCLLGVS